MRDSFLWDYVENVRKKDIGSPIWELVKSGHHIEDTTSKYLLGHRFTMA